jgi:hypothetical protein
MAAVERRAMVVWGEAQSNHLCSQLRRSVYFSLPRFGGGPGWGLQPAEVVEP